jgi:hypothetical protein
MISGKVRVTAVDEDQQEVIVDDPARWEFFGEHIVNLPHNPLLPISWLRQADILSLDSADNPAI